EESAHYRLLMDAAIKAIDVVKTLAKDIGIPIRLSAYNISEDDIPLLAENAAEQTRLLTNNPKSLRKEEAEEIYRRAL
ncbi:MAG: iron-containing alcohol dehydrogenase, partial [Candidatus Poribacteria bacterium]